MNASTTRTSLIKSRGLARSSLLFLMALFALLQAEAQVTQTTVFSSNELEYSSDVSSTDLLQGLAVTQAGTWGLPATKLNDGIHGPTAHNDSVAWPAPDASATFHLGLGTHGNGYDLSSIQTIAAWNGAQWMNVAYTLEVRLKGASSYTAIAIVNYAPISGNVPGSTKVTLTSPGGLVASGVEYVRLTQNTATASSGRTTFRELDVIGAPTPPPPAAPTVTAISPNTGATAGGTSVTITGTDFSGTPTVTIGGAAATGVTLDSATQITAVTPAHAAGAVSVLVTTPNGTNAANTLFTYAVPNTAPSFALPIVPAGDVWTPRDQNRNWPSITSSADGSKLAAVVYGGQIYTSTDSGATWTPRDSNRNWWSITSSADGTKLAAVHQGGQIYTSTDSGATWTPRDSNRNWVSITSSADGSKLAAVAGGGQIYTSTDSGLNWAPRESNRNWQCITSSADGSKLVAAGTGTQIYTSTDSGLNWAPRESNRNWASIASSADGTKLAAAAFHGNIFTSTDSGLNWEPRLSWGGGYQSITSSADGSKLAAVENGGRIYTSTDSGLNWTARESNRGWYSITSSADGSKLATVVFGGQIYTSTGSSAEVSVAAGSGAYTQAAFATAISPGPVADAGQTVNFTVSNNNNGLFTTQPVIASNGTLTFTPGNSAGVATVTVTAVDNGGTSNGGADTSAAQTFTITVPNTAPTDIALTPSSIAENNTANATVGTLSVTDADADQTHTFSFVTGTGDADNGSFTIDGTTLKITPSADFETKSSYSLRVQADDGNGGLFAKALTVTITDVNEAPVITSNGGGATASIDVAENTTAVTTVVASDTDTPAQTITYSKSGTHAAMFNIDSGTSELTFIIAPDFETAPGPFSITVTATDNGAPNQSDSQDISVAITDVNEAPTDITLTPSSIAENNAANATVSTLSATDADAGDTHSYSLVAGIGDTDNTSFTIDGTALKLTPSADFETKASYSLRVLADDGEGGTFAEALTVTITDVNEAPTDLALSNATLAENNAANASVGTLSASGDPDAGAVHTFSLVNGMGDADNAAFTIDGSALKLIPSANFEVKNSYSLRVEASDGLGGTFAKSLVISITDANDAPSDLTLTPSSIAENNAANATVGTLAAVDEDAGASALFSLVAGAGDTDNASFSIDGTSLKLIPVADFEIKSSYSLRVQVDDGNGGTFAKALTVTITDVNEAPTDIALSPSSIAENNAANATVGTLTAADVDAGQTHTFTKVTGTGDTDNDSFTIVGSDLKLTPVADFETKTSYSLRVQADDGNGGTFEKAFTVTITDVNEAPSVSTAAAKYLAVGGGVSNTNAVRLLRLNGAGTAIASSAALPSNTSGSHTYMLSYNATSGQMILGNSFFHLPTYLGGTFTLNLNGSLQNNSPWQAHLPSGKFVTVQRVGGTSGPIMTFNPATNAISNGGSGSGGIPEASWLYNGFLYSADEGLGVYRIAVAADGSTTGGASSVSPNPILGRSIPQGDGGYTETSRVAVDPNDGIALLSTGHNMLYLFDMDTAATSGDYIERNIYTAASGLLTSGAHLPYTDLRGLTCDSSAGVFYVQGALRNGSAQEIGDFILRVTKVGDVSVVAQELAGDLIYGTSGNNGFNMTLAGLTPNVFTLAENSANGTNVGTATAADPDASTTLSNWTITGGNTGNAFAIHPTTGVITVATASAIDFETNPSFTLSVTVSDGTNTSAAGTVTIAITNVNEASTDIALSNSNLDENNAANATVGTLSTSGDPDAGAAHTFSLVSGTGSTDNASFTIDGTALKLTPSANFEVKNSYSVRVRATDNGNPVGTFEEAFTVTITDVNEAPTDVTLAGINGVPVNVALNKPIIQVSSEYAGAFSASRVTDGSTFDSFGNNYWITQDNQGVGAFFTLDLQGAFSLSEIRLRNTTNTQHNDRGTGGFRILASNSVNGSNQLISPQTILTGTLTQGPGTLVSFTTSNGFTAGNYRYLHFVVDSVAPWASGTRSAGLNEIEVYGLPAPTLAENNAANATVGTLATTGDPDAGATHTFDLVSGTGDTDNAAFTLSSAGVLSINDPTNYEVKSSYSIRVRATDNGSPGLSYEKAFTISVTNVNEAVLSVSLTGSSVTEHFATNTTVGTFSSTDTDTGNSHTYSLVSGTGSDDNASFNISGNTLRTTAVFDFETKSSYTIRVRSTDQGGLFTEQDFAITILDANDPPSDLALSTAPIAENNTPGATVGTFSTTDENPGQTHTYTLVGGTGSTDNGSFTITGNELKLNASANFEVKSSYAIRVRTTDNGAPFNLFYEEAFTLTITDVQEAPWQISYQGGGPAGVIYANGLTARVVYSTAGVTTLAHADAMLVNGQNIASQFTGTISLVDFADSNTLGRFPGVLPFPGQSVLTAADNFALQVTGTIVVPTTGTYTFAVRSDDGSRIKIDGVTVFTDNTTHGETEFYTPVNLTAGVHTLDFVFFEGGGGGQVELFVATGSHGGYNGSFSLLQSYPLGINENTASGSTVTTFNATDDAGDTHDFTLVSGTGDTDNGSFTLSPAGVLTNNVVPDLETKSSYSIRVRATDGGGLFSEAAFIVVVNNVNEAVLSVALTGSSVNENDAVNTTVGTFSSTDTDTGNTHSYTLVAGTGSDDNASFNISGSTLRTSAVFDVETKNSYSIRVRSTDQGGLFLEDEFIITVNDINDAPTNISLSATAVDENDDPNTTVGLLSATDADPGDTHTFALVVGTGSTDNGSFSISGNQLILTPSANFEVKSSYSIRLRTTDSGTGGLTFDKVFTITINDVNDTPTDIALTATSIAENMASGSTVGLISGSDADAGQAATLVFSLVAGVGADDNASFEVDGNELNTAEVFNFEGNASYTIRLRATDTGGEFVEEAFTITITDANDAPILTSNGGGATGIDSVVENTTTVTTVTATDVDQPAQMLTYSISGDDAALFSIDSGTGELSFATAPNYENPDDLDNDNDYEVTVIVTDNGTGALTDSQALTVTVTDSNDAPILTSNGGGATGADSIAENTTAVTTVTATDADLPAQTLTYSITGGADAALFSIDSNTGELSFAMAPDFENPSDQGDDNDYEVTVTVTDDGTGLLTDSQALTVTVTDGNDAPTAIDISASMIAENSGEDAVVGTLSAVDEDNPANGQTHVFTLVSGTGSTDNASFAIVDDELQAAVNFDFETKASYSIRVRATDDGTPEASYEQVLVIMVGDVDIDIEDPDGRDLVSAVSDSYVFTDLQAMGTSSTARVFTISNPGTAPLTGIEVTIHGTQSGSFVLDTSATAETIDPGETTTFTVVFAPAYFDEREALIQVAHNGDEDNPFELGVTGTGATLVVTLAGGEVTVTDYGDRTDALNLAVSGTDLVLTSGVMLSNAGTGSGTGTVTIPLASITNGITVNIGLGGGTVTFGDMTGYTGPLTVAPVLPDNSLTIRVNGPVNVGPHPILFHATRTVTISDDLQASGAGSISITTRQGIAINSAAVVSVENGDLTLSANQTLPALDGTFTGIDITGASQVSSTGSGQVTINGKSGQDAGFGVTIDGGSTVTGGTTGTLTINGVSNALGTSRYGLNISGAGTTVTTLGANISLTGTGGGSPTGNKNHGVVINSGASVLAVGNANLDITGTGGVEGQGVRIRDDAGLTLVAVVDGDLTITGHEGSGTGAVQGFHYVGGKSGRIESTGSGDLVFNADTVEITGAGTSKGTIQTTGGGSLTFKPLTASTSIGLGGGTGTLALTDAALAYIQDGFSLITIGDALSGTGDVTIDTITLPDSTLIAGGLIRNAGAADVTLTAGDTLTLKGTVAPGASPGKLTVSGKLSLAADAIVSMEIGGLVAGTQNDQIIASETVDIGSNVTLNLVQAGGFIPTGTETFILIQRTDGTGTFNGMPEGYVFTDLFGSGQPATLTYLAGTSGNDVALVMGALIPDIKVEQPVGTELVDGIASISLGKAAVTKRGITRTFTVTNTGTGAVTDLALSLSGTHAADFAFGSLESTTLAEGASTTFTVTITPSALGTRTAMLQLASNVNGTKNPFDIILTGTGIATEATKPTLAIASPATSAKVNEGTAVVTGTVKDASGIALVEAKIGTGAWVEATLNVDAAGTSGSYSLALSPAPGLNSLSVRATDTSGNVTTTIRSFTYVVLRPLTLATEGTGSGTLAFISPSTAVASSLQLASRYTLRATAAAGSFFNGWSSPNSSVTIASPLATTLSFTMVEDAEITANFITNPFTSDLTGNYSGLIKAATGTTAAKSNTGLFTAKLLGTGSFSARVNLDGVAKAASGTFNPNTGDCTVSVVNGTTTWSLNLHLDLAGGTNRITGSLTQVTGGIPGDVSDIIANRAAFSTLATVPTANRGTYTVALPARASQSNPSVVYPTGAGVGTITVAASGAVTLKGTLADGRVFTQTAALSADLDWPVFISFASRVGSLSGVATLDDTAADSDVTASDLDWYLAPAASAYFPDGWNDGIKTDLTGALYAVPSGSAVLPGLGATDATSGNAELSFSGGNLTSDQTKNVNITTTSVVSRAPTTDTSFTVVLTKTSGALSGSFVHSSGGKAAYKGTILQKGANAGGYGHFLLAPAAAGNAGAVTLLPK